MTVPLAVESLAPHEAATGGGARPAFRLLRSSLPQALRSQVRSASELVESRERDEPDLPLATAVPALDRLLEGGLPRGCLVELLGGRTSGRFSVVLAALAAATQVGEAAALVDLGDNLDPQGAIASGVDAERLLWLRPGKLKQALAAAEMVLATGFSLVVLDLGHPPIPGGRGVEAAWLRLARAARSQRAALLVSTPYRVSGTAAAVVLAAGRPRAAWQGSGAGPRLLAGLSGRLAVEKHRGRLPGQSEGLELKAGSSLVPPPAPADLADAPRRAPAPLPVTLPIAAAG